MFMFPAGGDPNMFGTPISKSLRFDGVNTYLSNAGAAQTDGKRGVVSMWVKRSTTNTGAYEIPYTAYSGASDYTYISFNTLDQLDIVWVSAAAVVQRITTNAVYRDVGQWFHVYVGIDSTQATGTDRVKLYVNGARVTSFAAETVQVLNQVHPLVGYSTWTNYIGLYPGPLYMFNGYLAEVHSVDGTTPSVDTFGMTCPHTGEWIPKVVSGVTYGANGSYLSFADNSSTAALGYDDAGSNDWTTFNFSVTAGVDNDSLSDTPTQNWCILANNANAWWGAHTLSDGGLKVSYAGPSSYTVGCPGTMAVTSDKWYWEIEFDTIPATNCCAGGVYDTAYLLGNTNAYANPGHWVLMDNGNFSADGAVAAASGTGAFAAGDIACFALNANTGELWVGKNGTWVGDPVAGTGEIATISMTNRWLAPFAAAFYSGTSGISIANFGQRAFAYTQPAGFKSLNARNLPKPLIRDPSSGFQPVLYTGNGTTQTITGVSFAPDLVWIKERSAIRDHRLVDSVRGATKEVYSNLNSDELTDANGLTAFTSNGFSVGTTLGYNENTGTFVAWCFKEGARYGIDIVTQTAPAAGNVTVAHSLGVTPKLILAKARAGGAASWAAWFKGMGTDHMTLNATVAATASGYMVSQSSTDVVISLAFFNASQPMVTYLFAEVPGFSRIGKYTGSGTVEGPFVWCGFRPAFLMTKRADVAGAWLITDCTRSIYNPTQHNVWAENSTTETTTVRFDFLSNGFKLRSTNADENAASGTFYFIAFADSPFRYNRAR